MGETKGTRSHLENHTANGPSVAESTDGLENEIPSVEAELPCEHQDPLPKFPLRTESQAETRKPARSKKLKWPKSKKAEARHKLDTDLIVEEKVA